MFSNNGRESAKDVSCNQHFLILHQHFLISIWRTYWQRPLENFITEVSVGGRNIYELHFADDVVLLTRSEEELQNITNHMDHMARAYRMMLSHGEVIAHWIQSTTDINVNGQPLKCPWFNICGIQHMMIHLPLFRLYHGSLWQCLKCLNWRNYEKAMI